MGMLYALEMMWAGMMVVVTTTLVMLEDDSEGNAKRG